MKEHLLELMKKQLFDITRSLTLENRKDMEAQIYRVMTILETAETMEHFTEFEDPSSLILPYSLMNTQNSNNQEYKSEPFRHFSLATLKTEKPNVEVEVERDSEASSQESSEEPILHRFSRRLKGGFLDDINAYIPEKIVKDLELHDGDLLTAEFLFKPDNGPARYNFHVAERSDNPVEPKDLIPIKMGIVTYEPARGGYCIRKTIQEESIIHNEEEVVMLIHDDDVESMDLKEGDVVDAAFYSPNPHTGRVRWKFETEQNDSTSSPKPSSFYKKKDKEEGQQQQIEQIFEGKSICAMGFVPGHPSFRQEVESRGGEFVSLSGRESQERLSSYLKKVDCLIIMKQHVGHGGTNYAVPICKENKIPYDSLDTYGRTSFVNKAIELLDAQPVQQS